ncbi:hypothetical protein PROFUN_11280 [Planoprotostelium fungivorum]|uniref:Uncharacterized protein n=1 Tax=Planoprotostelium fungivorum TaxID=1890364 RepID=A0A2P6NAH6_9EUKA|nr:hypothetical protein PROFUN_11280 [Planoprotostelium fungivorum]
MRATAALLLLTISLVQAGSLEWPSQYNFEYRLTFRSVATNDSFAGFALGWQSQNENTTRTTYTITTTTGPANTTLWEFHNNNTIYQLSNGVTCKKVGTPMAGTFKQFAINGTSTHRPCFGDGRVGRVWRHDFGDQKGVKLCAELAGKRPLWIETTSAGTGEDAFSYRIDYLNWKPQAIPDQNLYESESPCWSVV